MRFVREFLLNEDGPTAVEYAIMLALIVVVCVGAIRLAGEATSDSFLDSAASIKKAMGGGS